MFHTRNMHTSYFTGARVNKPSNPIELPTAPCARHSDPAGYLAEQGLIDAVNVALMLGQPLLLTGEPGTGKTQLAFRLAWELGYPEPLMFETKSTSFAKDLFYNYDSLRRFHAAYTQEASKSNRDYVTYNALGLAILYANDEVTVKDKLPSGFAHPGKQRSVVLIDEIDKAPRDFPNDVLNEIEQMYFRVPELGNDRVQADPAMRPVVVITSNSERNLPEAFLRRCIYYNIPFPDKTRLAEIVVKRLERFRDSTHTRLTKAIEFFEKLRSANLTKPPSTAELIQWLSVMPDRGVSDDNFPIQSREEWEWSLRILVKTLDDLQVAKRCVESFVRHALW